MRERRNRKYDHIRYQSSVLPAATMGKRTVRMQMYAHAAKAPRYGHVVTLAGPEPLPEAALMRDYLQWSPSRTWFVDWAKVKTTRTSVLQALDTLAAQYPGANVVCDDVTHVIDQLPGGVSFANLDFMGHLTRTSVQPALHATCRKLLHGGVIGLTYYRGREQDVGDGAYDVWCAAGQDPDQVERIFDNNIRWRGVRALVERIGEAAGCSLQFVQGLEYHHKHSPMGTAIWKRI